MSRRLPLGLDGDESRPAEGLSPGSKSRRPGPQGVPEAVPTSDVCAPRTLAEAGNRHGYVSPPFAVGSGTYRLRASGTASGVTPEEQPVCSPADRTVIDRALQEHGSNQSLRHILKRAALQLNASVQDAVVLVRMRAKGGPSVKPGPLPPKPRRQGRQSPPPPRPQPKALGDLTVTVIDDETNAVISGVPTKVSGPDTRTMPTDPGGKALFTGLTPGGYTVTHSSACVSAASASATVVANRMTKAELRVHHTHAAITIKELTYTGNNVVEKDTTGNFASPEWVEGRAQADQAPVAYARNRKVAFNAKFKVVTRPCRSESVAVKGTATFGPAALEWIGTVTVGPGDSEVTVSLTSNKPLANEVGIFESSDIAFEMNPATRGWSSAGTARNVLYVTLGNPSGSPNYWTLLEISCRGAAGTSTEDDFVKSSFDPYRSTVGNGKGFRRKRDGTELTYYKNGAGTPSSGVFTCSDILSRADGTGRCGGWARFMVAMHQVHGVTSSSVIGVVPINARLLIVKNCTFTGAGSLAVPFTHEGKTECVKNDGIFGQGKNNPQFTFGDHALVKHSTGIYDPSYGVGPKADLRTWEDGGIAGIGELPAVSFTYDGDPQFLPRLCSPGFIRYTVGPGETMAAIATKFGILSDALLYGHPYNAALRALRPLIANVAAGDVVIIPRDISSTVAILKIA